MAEPLALDPDAFAEDGPAWPGRAANRPGARRVDGSRVVTVRHAAGSRAAEDAVRALGLAWPRSIGDSTLREEDGTCVVRRHPGECLLVGTDASVQDALLDALAPGRAADAFAVDLSHGIVVVVIEGPHLDEWMARLVDAGALPRTPGRAAHARMIDIAVGLLRLADDRLWLFADRPLAPYIADWLSFTHVAAFGSSP